MAPLYPQPIMAWPRTQSWWWEKSGSPACCSLSPSLVLCLCVSLFLLPISVCSSVHLSRPFRASLLPGLRLSSPEVCIKKFILCRACCLNSPSRPLRRKCTQQGWSRFGFSASGEMHLPAWCSALEITRTLLPTPVDFTGGDKGLRGVECLSEGIVCLSGQSSGCMALCVCCHIDLRNDR